MLFIRKLAPSLNEQTDSIRARVFTRTIFSCLVSKSALRLFCTWPTQNNRKTLNLMQSSICCEHLQHYWQVTVWGPGAWHIPKLDPFTVIFFRWRWFYENKFISRISVGNLCVVSAQPKWSFILPCLRPIKSECSRSNNIKLLFSTHLSCQTQSINRWKYSSRPRTI